MDMNLMLIIVQENDAESLASAFKRSQIQATRIDAKGLVSSRKLNVFLVGTERTDEVLQLVSSNCKERAMEIEDQEYNGHMFVDVENHRHWRRYHLHPGGGQADEGQGRMLRGLRAAGKHKAKNTNAKTGLHTSHMESRYHFTHQSLLNKELIAGIWHKSDMTCALDSYSQGSLVLCTVACDTAGKDFSSLGYVSL